LSTNLSFGFICSERQGDFGSDCNFFGEINIKSLLVSQKKLQDDQKIPVYQGNKPKTQVTKPNILITGSRAPVALDLARNLNKEGHKVYSADSIKHPLCRFSNSVECSFHVNPPKHSSEEYIKDLIEICKTYNIKKIIPTCEEIFYLSKYKERFDGIADVFVDDFNKINRLHNKWSFMTLLQDLGEETPLTWLIEKESDFAPITHRPLILKPVFSRFGSKVFYINEQETLPKLDVSESAPWVAQEFLPGRVWCSYSVANKGEISLQTTYTSEFKIASGASIHFEHCSNPQIDNWVKRIVHKLSFTGQIAFDFIEVSSNRYLPIECNPRATSGLHLVSQIPNFTEAFLNGNAKFLKPEQSKSKSLKVPLLFSGWRSSQSLKNWIYALIHSKDVVYLSRDPLPSLHQLATIFEFWIKGCKLGINTIEASTEDIEFNGES
jgi:predicted ATP-grasp superfamily ATP-dependent carboligase